MSFIEHEPTKAANDAATEATRAIETILRSDMRPKLLRPKAPEPEPEPEQEQAIMVEKVVHTYLPLDALEAVSRALMYGAKKGDAWSWKINPISWTERLAKAQRHIFEFQKGIEIDPLSGEQHLACAITQLMFLQSYVLTGTGTDDRFKP